jgi:hypothetical protein
MESGIIKMRKVSLVGIRVGILSDFFHQTVQNDAHEERSIINFPQWQHDDIDDSNGAETYLKHDLPCTDKAFWSCRASDVSIHLHYESQIFEVNSGFSPRNDPKKFVDWKFVELSKKFREILILSDF